MVLPNFTIVIPIFNEKKNIIKLLKNIVLKVKKSNFEIIVVDDSSNDGSQQVIKKFIKKKKYIKLICRKKFPRDLSMSCIEGFYKSRNNYILVMDGDGQHDPKYIKAMIKKLYQEKLDIVVGARKLFTNKIKGLSYFRKLSSQIIVIAINLLFGNKTGDPMSGFFVFKKKVFLRSKSKLFKKGYKILFDLITARKNLKIKDIEINFLKRKKGYSKMNIKIVMILVFQIFYKILLK
tara:strand:- start:421 stop:1125 length:705 start_codon:yes stop_codon:yes gene_type:complete